MRFHVGFSFRFKTIKKYIIPFLFGILAYFGFNGIFANAASTSNFDTTYTINYDYEYFDSLYDGSMEFTNIKSFLQDIIDLSSNYYDLVIFYNGYRGYNNQTFFFYLYPKGNSYFDVAYMGTSGGELRFDLSYSGFYYFSNLLNINTDSTWYLNFYKCYINNNCTGYYSTNSLNFGNSTGIRNFYSNNSYVLPNMPYSDSSVRTSIIYYSSLPFRFVNNIDYSSYNLLYKDLIINEKRYTLNDLIPTYYDLLNNSSAPVIPDKPDLSLSNVRLHYGKNDDKYLGLYQENDIEFTKPNQGFNTSTNFTTDDWFTSLDTFTPIKEVDGQYLNVHADYVVRIKPLSNYPSISWYLPTALNTLKKENLRCALNNEYREGYTDEFGSPKISNFLVDYRMGDIPDNWYEKPYTIRVRFDYSQKIASTTTTQSNVSCWFERSPADGLFFRPGATADGNVDLGKIEVAIGTNVLSYSHSVSSTATDDLLGSLNDKIDTQTQITQDIYDFMTDTTPPSVDDDNISGVSGLLPPGPVDSLLNIPPKYLSRTINSLNGTCSPLRFNFVFDQPMEFPCFETMYNQFPSSVKIFTEIVPAGFILILYFKHLYKKVDRATSLESNSDDEWGVI